MQNINMDTKTFSRIEYVCTQAIDDYEVRDNLYVCAIHSKSTLAFCQPALLWSLRKRVEVRSLKDGLIKNVIGYNQKILEKEKGMSDDALIGCSAHEAEHARTHASASISNIAQFGIEYMVYEMIRNDTSLQSTREFIDLFAQHEQLLDLRVIQRGKASHLQAFRLERQKFANVLDPRYDREACYLNNENIVSYTLMSAVDLQEIIEQREQALGITTKRILGKSIVGKVVRNRLSAISNALA